MSGIAAPITSSKPNPAKVGLSSRPARFTDRPADGQKCVGCDHTFGQHYTTYDGKRVGCGYESSDQRDVGCARRCTAFTIAYTWPPQIAEG